MTSTYVSQHDNWTVGFFYGNEEFADKSASLFVRCVHGNESTKINKHFTKNTDVLIDNMTGLHWQNNQDTVASTRHWKEAIDYCESLVLEGTQDWRLPNINELLSMVDAQKLENYLYEKERTIGARRYWSSTSEAEPYSYNAWYVEMSNDNKEYHEEVYYTSKASSNDIDKLYVRCVRGESK